MARFAFAALIALLGSACGSKGAVSLIATAESPELTVEQTALGTTLSGGFDLYLELGEYAEDGMALSLAGFGLYRDGEEIVPSLSLTSSVDFPVHVGPGDTRSAALSIDSDATLDSEVGEALCAGNVVYRGGVTSADGKVTPAASALFAPSCP